MKTDAVVQQNNICFHVVGFSYLVFALHQVYSNLMLKRVGAELCSEVAESTWR